MLMHQLAIATSMTGSLWGLVIFILWTIAIVIGLIITRIRHLAAGGAVSDFAIPNDQSLLWRLFRVQANLAENLPLYLGVVFLLTVRGIAGIAIDGLIAVYITSRLLHSIIHIVGLNPILRVVSLVIQFCCLIVLTLLTLF
jgi:uncharacterized MAPEG superfamily protein